MFCYASRTGTLRNLEVMRRHGWGLLVSRAGKWRTEGFERIALDNGAWADYQSGGEFDEDAFERFLDKAATFPVTPDWLVLPDVVADGPRSLQLSKRYLNRGMAAAPLCLLAVQNGITPADVAPLVGSRLGIFLGGDTKWKLWQMRLWGQFCAEKGIYYHVARVNSIKRIALAASCGAHSIDGSSASRYAAHTPMLSYAARQADLFSVRSGP